MVMFKRHTLAEIHTMNHAELEKAIVASEALLAKLTKEHDNLKNLCKEQGWKIDGQ